MHFWTPPIEVVLVIASFLVFISIVASRASAKLGVPALLIFLLVGILAGSEGIGGIYFDDPHTAQFIGVIALILILFAGGLDTQWASARPILWQGIGLATIGVFITAILLGWFVSLITGFSLTEGLLFGAIVSSTDAAAVFSVMRSENVSLRGNLKPLLELESGSNDAMAVFLTLGLIQLLTVPAASILDLVPMFFRQMILGALIGYAMGRIMIFTINRLRLEYEGLYPVLTLTLTLFTYGMAALVGGNGFLAVYIAGIIMGNSEFIHKRSLMRFHDGLAWLMQITMFLTLGLLVFPSRLLPIAGVGLLVAVFLILIARPISVFVTLLFSKVDIRDRTMISWVGLRGAVPIILATFPLIAGVQKADMIFNMVFFIVITSALIQGSTIPLVAKWLRVDAPAAVPEGQLPHLQPHECIICKLSEIRIPQDSAVIGKQIVETGFPESIDILLINREQELITPTGSTILQPADVLLVIANEESIIQLQAMLHAPSS